MSDWRVHGYDPRRPGRSQYVTDTGASSRWRDAEVCSHATATEVAANLNRRAHLGLRWTVELHRDRSTTP